jgi:hypothetical protein
VVVKTPHIATEPSEPLWEEPYLVLLSTKQESEWLDWNLGSTPPESSTGFPLPIWSPLNLLLRRLTTHVSPSQILSFSLRRLLLKEDVLKADLLPYLFITLYLTLTIVLSIGLWVTFPQEWTCLHCGALIFGFVFLCSLPPIICLML